MRLSDYLISCCSLSTQEDSKRNADVSLHPIQAIFEELLPLFKAHYASYNGPHHVQPKPAPPSQGMSGGLSRFDELRKRWRLPERKEDQAPDYDPTELAAELQNHFSFASILLSKLEDLSWPVDDKLSNRVNKRYNTDKRFGCAKKGYRLDDVQEEGEPASELLVKEVTPSSEARTLDGAGRQSQAISYES